MLQIQQQPSVAGAFDKEKFTKYVKALDTSRSTQAIFEPSQDELQCIQNVIATEHFKERSTERFQSCMQELRRSLKTSQDCFLKSDLRYGFFLKISEAETIFLVFSNDFTKLYEVVDEKKGKTKARYEEKVNLLQVTDGDDEVDDNLGASLTEKVISSILNWNRVRQNQVIIVNEALTSLLSTAFENCFIFKAVHMVSTTTTCILTHDLSRIITCYPSRFRYSEWIDAERKKQHKLIEQSNRKKEIREAVPKHEEKKLDRALRRKKKEKRRDENLHARQDAKYSNLIRCFAK